MKRLSISIADVQVDWIRGEAKRRRTTISAIVSEAIKNEMRNKLSREIIEGLMEDSEFQKSMANNDWNRVAQMEGN